MTNQQNFFVDEKYFPLETEIAKEFFSQKLLHLLQERFLLQVTLSKVF